MSKENLKVRRVAQSDVKNQAFSTPDEMVYAFDSGARYMGREDGGLDALVTAQTNELTGGIEIGAGAVVYVPVVADDVSAAATNTAAIQKALNAGGDVRVLAPGVVWIDDTLIYDSLTRIMVGDKTTIKMAAASAGRPLLRSMAYVRMTTAPVSVALSWTSGPTFSVAWTAHGLSVNDAIWLDGDTLQAYFKGVFLVDSVTDDNNVVIRANRTPLAAPLGVVNAVVATSHSEIVGGTWDYNYDGYAPVEIDRFGHQHFGTYDVWERHNRVNDCAKYSYYWAASLACGHEDIGADHTNSDILKIYGPAVGYRGRGLYGVCEDDVVSMQTKEPPAYIAYQPYCGDVLDCEVADVRAISTTSLAVYYANAIADGVLDSCAYRGISGRSAYGFRIASNSTERSIGSVYASDIHGDYGAATFFDGGSAKSVRVERVSAPTTRATAGSVVTAGTGYTADQTIIEPVFHTWHNVTTGYAIDWHGAGELLYIRMPQALNTSGQTRLLQLAADANVVNAVIDGYEGDGDQLVENYATNSPTITIANSRIKCAAVLSARASCSLHMRGNDIHNASNGVVRFNSTATVNLRTDGANRLRAGSWSQAPAGTPTLNLYGWDITVDPITVPGASSTVGQFCTSTQAGVEGGPAVRTPAGWVALGTGTAGVNTVVS